MLRRLTVVSLMLLCSAGLLAYASKPERVPIRKSFSDFPMQIGEWRGRPAPALDEKILAIVGVDEYINVSYLQPRQPSIGLYVGYYESQRQGDVIHSPMNCLPGAGWQPVSKGRLAIRVSELAAGGGAVGRSIEVNRYLIEKGANRLLVLYWYQSHGRVIASEYVSKAYMVMDAIRTNRTDAALVRVITPIVDAEGESLQSAEDRAVGFVQHVFPLLPEYLPA